MSALDNFLTKCVIHESAWLAEPKDWVAVKRKGDLRVHVFARDVFEKMKQSTQEYIKDINGKKNFVIDIYAPLVAGVAAASLGVPTLVAPFIIAFVKAGSEPVKQLTDITSDLEEVPIPSGER